LALNFVFFYRYGLYFIFTRHLICTVRRLVAQYNLVL